MIKETLNFPFNIMNFPLEYYEFQFLSSNVLFNILTVPVYCCVTLGFIEEFLLEGGILWGAVCAKTINVGRHL